MAISIHMKKNTRGFYSMEAAIFLPIVILTILSLGYFMKVEGVWENCIHGATDESILAAGKAYDGISVYSVGKNVSQRIARDNPQIDDINVKRLMINYHDGYMDDVTSYHLNLAMPLNLPLGFSRKFQFEYGIKFRGFTGVDHRGTPLGVDGLEKYQKEKPVWIFPHSGEKYHKEGCTYVKSSAEAVILTSAIRKKYASCKICDSEGVALGDVVFCFKADGSAYHRGTCRALVRHTTVVDESEAISRGYGPCSKCGGY